MGQGRVAGWVVLSACIASSACGVAGCSEVQAPRVLGGEAAAGLPEAPAIDRPVVDQTGLLSAADVEQLSAHLLLLRERTGAQMAVLLVATTGDEPIEDYSMRVAEAWRGGAAERDDGLLLTMAMSDRRMRLEVGYGLEQLVTDAEAQVVVDGMREDLRAGETARAIAGAIEAVARELPRTDPSLLDGGLLARPAIGAWTGAPFTLLALVCVVVFLAIRDPETSGKERDRERHARRAWAGLAAALVVLSVLLAWLYAGLSGPVVGEPIAFLGSAAALLAAGWPLDRRARRLPTPSGRWMTFAIFMFLATFATMAFSGLFLGSLDALPLLAVPFVLGLILLPVFLGASGDGGSSYSSSSSSYSSISSSYSSSSSSSSSSYSGGGGGFGGGGASSSW